MGRSNAAPLLGATVWCRGIFCIFCRSRRGMDRCGLLWRRLGLVWALPLARGRSDIANLFAGAAACARVGGLLPGDAAARFRWRARRRWLRRLALHPTCALEETLAQRRGQPASPTDPAPLAPPHC